MLFPAPLFFRVFETIYGQSEPMRFIVAITMFFAVAHVILSLLILCDVLFIFEIQIIGLKSRYRESGIKHPQPRGVYLGATKGVTTGKNGYPDLKSKRPARLIRFLR